MDDADRAGPVIQHVVDDAMERARRALHNQRLQPIIQVLDGTRFGVCHYCESPIKPGQLFCDQDMEPEHSCSVEWEHEMRRKKEMGL